MKDSSVRRVHLASPEESLRTALERMRRLEVRHLPVVTDGRLAGILSDRDLLLHAWSGQVHDYPDDLTVGDVMAKNVVTARFGTPMADLAKLMLANKVDALPLTDGSDSLVGIVTSTDVMRLVAERSEELASVEHTAEFMDQFRWDMPEIV